MATKAEQQAFITSAARAARKSEAAIGVPASVTIAQAILESGWGEKHMGDANNYFGIKAQNRDGLITWGDIATGYVIRLTKEYDKTGKAYTVNAYFRSYDDMAGSFIDHGVFLTSNKRYLKALQAYSEDGDADEFARGLQTAGYATDPNYAGLLISIMTKHDLYQYDTKSPAG